MGEILNCSQRVYSNYERGDLDIPTEILIKLADFHDVSVDYILNRTNKRKWQYNFYTSFFNLEISFKNSAIVTIDNSISNTKQKIKYSGEFCKMVVTSSFRITLPFLYKYADTTPSTKDIKHTNLKAIFKQQSQKLLFCTKKLIIYG